MNATVIEKPPAGEAKAPAARTNRGSLDSLTIRRRTTGAQAAARAELMRKLRYILPIAALVLVAIFFINTRSGGGDDAFLDDFADLNATTQNLSSVKPQFSGVDNRGNPYEITADAANQRQDSREMVELTKPRAVTAGDGDQSVVEADAGVFNTDAKTLLLKDGVTFEREIGRDNYVLRSTAATVSIDDQTVVTEEGVKGDGPGGSTLSAKTMQADNRSGAVVFEGDVSMRLYPKSTKPDEAANDANTEDGENNE